MTKFLWVLTIIGSVAGAGLIYLGLTMSSGAPQEAAAAAMGVSIAVIPYCLARAVSELSTK